MYVTVYNLLCLPGLKSQVNALTLKGDFWLWNTEKANQPVTDTGYRKGCLQHPKIVHLTDQVSWEESEDEGETRIGRLKVLDWRDKMERGDTWRVEVLVYKDMMVREDWVHKYSDWSTRHMTGLMAKYNVAAESLWHITPLRGTSSPWPRHTTLTPW